MATGVCLMLIPTDAVDDEHCTLLYAGDYDAPTLPENVIKTYASIIARMYAPIETCVVRHSLFGDVDGKVMVAELLVTTMLAQLRDVVADYTSSRWGFKPHITAVGERIRPVGSHVQFNRIAVWWAGDRTTWRFGSGERCA